MSQSRLLGAAYISRIADSLADREVESIVAASRRRNNVDRLTGFLVRAGVNFVQYLEGPEAGVSACLRRIENDRRHHDMTIVALTALDSRRFSDWSMGYFVGDTDGTERLERTLTEWSGTDLSLLSEIWRIASAAANRESRCANVVHGPFHVLIRRDVHEA